MPHTVTTKPTTPAAPAAPPVLSSEEVRRRLQDFRKLLRERDRAAIQAERKAKAKVARTSAKGLNLLGTTRLLRVKAKGS
jgi:hypothetical protein